MQDYEDLQQQYSEAVKSPNSKQQQQQQQEQQYESEANSSVAGEPVSSAQPPAAPQTPPQLGSRVSQMPRPPVLALEASRLLPGADPEIGFGTADLEQEVHEFCACLTASVNPHAESPYALALTNSITSSLLGRAAQEHGNHAPLSGLRPCFLGHVIMHWVDMEIWADPMAALGCALGLGTGPLPRGPDEANLLSLIRSHAARRWCEVTKAAGDAGSIGGSAATAAASVGARVQQLQRRLAAWLGNFPSLAAALEADPHIRCLVLRALHLGLFALASHPLLRVRVSPVVFVLPCEARTLQQLGPSQVVRRHIRLSSGRGGPEAPPHGKHVLCSLQPSVGFWMGAEGVGAGSTGQVVVREEVVTWEWNQNSWVPFM